MESLVSLIDPEIDEDVSTLAGLNYCCSSFITWPKKWFLVDVTNREKGGFVHHGWDTFSANEREV